MRVPRVAVEGRARSVWYALPRPLRRRIYPALRPVHATAVSAWQARRGLGRYERTEWQDPEAEAAGWRLHAFGAPDELRWLVDWLFEGRAVPVHRRPVSLLQLHAASRSSLDRGHVVAVALPRPWTKLLPRSLSVLPQSVEVVVPVEAAMARIRARNAPLGKYLRRMERTGLTTDVTDEPGSLALFYERFYLPYMRHRFGDSGRIKPRSFYDRYPGRWEVLRVWRSDRLIAAGTGLVHEDRYRFVDLGYRDGDLAHRNAGAGHALYSLAVQRAAAYGLAELDLGPERPLLEHPNLHYKRQWGAVVRPNPWASTVIGLGFSSPQVRDVFLRRSPVVTESARARLEVLGAGPRLATEARYRDLGLGELHLIDSDGGT